MFLIQKYTQYKAAQAEQSKRKVTEKELSQLNHKIDKLLSKLDEHEPEIAANQDEECVVCVNAKATMETYPCGHRVICRKCFVKTIQMAVAQRLLPLRCVICRAKILRLKHLSGMMPISSSSSSTTSSTSTTHHWYNVPQSASLYSVTSNTSAVSGVSSASSCSSTSSYKTCASSFSFRKSHSAYSKMGYEPLRSQSPSPTRRSSTISHTPTTKSGIGTMMIKKDNRISPVETVPIPPKGKLKLVQDFQREFRISQQNSSSSNSNFNKSRLSTSSSTHSSINGSSGGGGDASGSTRIKCAKHLVHQAHSSCTSTSAIIQRDSSRGLLASHHSHKENGTIRKIPNVGTSSSQSCPSFKQLRVNSITDKSGKLDSSSPKINSSQKTISFKQNNNGNGNSSSNSSSTNSVTKSSSKIVSG